MTLKHYTWLVDFSNTIGQKDSYIPLMVFKARNQAREYNKSRFPQGIIRKVEIKVKE